MPLRGSVPCARRDCRTGKPPAGSITHPYGWSLGAQISFLFFAEGAAYRSNSRISFIFHSPAGPV